MSPWWEGRDHQVGDFNFKSSQVKSLNLKKFPSQVKSSQKHIKNCQVKSSLWIFKKISSQVKSSRKVKKLLQVRSSQYPKLKLSLLGEGFVPYIYILSPPCTPCPHPLVDSEWYTPCHLKFKSKSSLCPPFQFSSQVKSEIPDLNFKSSQVDLTWLDLTWFWVISSRLDGLYTQG